MNAVSRSARKRLTYNRATPVIRRRYKPRIEKSETTGTALPSRGSRPVLQNVDAFDDQDIRPVDSVHSLGMMS